MPPATPCTVLVTAKTLTPAAIRRGSTGTRATPSLT
jgi:hypothetical protein